MTNDKDSAVLPETYEQIHKQALDRKGRPVKSDIGIPVTDENPEYTKLLNELITLRWKCGDQAAELADLREALDKLIVAVEFEVPAIRDGVRVTRRLDILESCAAEARAALQEQSK